MAQSTRIVLGGALADEVGRAEWRLHLDRPSPAEALRAIDANTGGRLRRYLGTKGREQFYRVAIAREDNALGADELEAPTGQSDIYILPVVAGAEKGWEKILIGALLIAAAWWNPGSWAYVAGEGLTLLGTAAVGAGASLVLGGAVQLLTPVPSFGQSDGDSRGSNVFQGNASTITQGGAVGVVYGRMLVSPMPVSLSFTAFDQALPNSFETQEYNIIHHPDGLIEYVPIQPDDYADLPI